MAKGLVENGSEILYKANVTSIILAQGKAVSLTLVLWIDDVKIPILGTYFIDEVRFLFCFAL